MAASVSTNNKKKNKGSKRQQAKQQQERKEAEAAAAVATTDRKIPVTVLTGFLGSGKTTLLNHILTAQHGKRIAVIENEYGEVGVDDAIVSRANKAFGEEDVIEMNNGCICCTVRGDLIRILTALLERKGPAFDAILIETTGLADPAPVAQTFFVHEELQAKLRLDAILTVVDAKHLVQHLDDDKPEGVENEAVEQLAFADRVLLNKIDLVDEAELAAVEARIRAINAFAPIFRTVQSKVDLDQVLGLRAFDLQRVLDVDPEFLDEGAEHQHDQTVSSVGFRLEGEMNLGQLELWLSRLLKDQGPQLFRYKGVLAVKGFDTKWIFQGVHMLFGASMGEPWGPGEARESRFVFIGRDLDRAALTKGFNACVVTEPLRFEVGTAVRCKVAEATWKLGEVIKLWDDGNPYRVRLDDGTEIWAPVDSDVAIREACRASTRM